MRSAVLSALMLIATQGCSTLIPQPSQRANPDVPGGSFDTIAMIAGGSGRNDAFMRERAQARVRNAGVVTLVEVNGRWDSEPEAVEAVCGPDQSPALDGLVIVEGNRLALWDCTSGDVAFEAEGAYEGVDYMTDRLLDYLKQEG